MLSSSSMLLSRVAFHTTSRSVCSSSSLFSTVQYPLSSSPLAFTRDPNSSLRYGPSLPVHTYSTRSHPGVPLGPSLPSLNQSSPRSLPRTPSHLHKTARFLSSNISQDSKHRESRNEDHEVDKSTKKKNISNIHESEQEGGHYHQSQSSWQRFKDFLMLAYPDKALLALAFGALVVNAAANLVFPAAVGKVVDSTLENESGVGDKKGSGKWGLFSRNPKVASKNGDDINESAAAVQVLNEDEEEKKAHRRKKLRETALILLAEERITAALRKNMFRSVMAQETGFFDSQRTGELISRLSTDTTVVSKSLTESIATGARRSLEGVGGVALLCYLSPSLTGLMLSVVPPVFVGGMFFGRSVKKLSKDAQRALAKTTELAEERVGAIRTVRTFANEAAEVERYNSRVDSVYQILKRVALLKGGFYGGVGLAGQAALLTVLTYGGHLVIDNSLSVGELASFLMYSVYVGAAASGLASTYGDIMKGMGASSRMFDLLERVPTMVDGALTPPVKGQVRFGDVHFSYPMRPDIPILKGLSFDVPVGKSVAIVGPSGSGKSTILHLLGRLYDTSAGGVEIDGINVKDFNQQWLRRHVGFVSQEPVLFAGTVRENIMYGLSAEERDSDDVQERVQRAAQLAMAHGFISKLPDGYDTEVGEKGVRLSGGEKQRVAIARAIVKQPAVLVLDEATSALDSESEHSLQLALEQVSKDRTMLVVAHRLSTVIACDEIICLKDGQVQERGTHSQLLAQRGIYSALVEKQLGGAIEL